MLIRIKDEKRVDELPMMMESNPNQAILVEKVKDSPFPFYAKGYGVRSQYALALDCDPKKVGWRSPSDSRRALIPWWSTPPHAAMSS